MAKRVASTLEEEAKVLGLCLIVCQKVEYALYGIVSHLSQLPEAQKERRFRELTPEKFLRGDPAELKATLGQLLHVFGDRLLLRSAELDRFLLDRNLVCHDYFRHFLAASASERDADEAINFLRDFLKRSSEFYSVVRGLLVVITEAVAARNNRTRELSEDDIRNRQTYFDYVAKHHAI